MPGFVDNLKHSLFTKFMISFGLILMFSISIWAYFNIKYQQERLKKEVSAGAERLSDTIQLGTHYAMMNNSRNDINQIIINIARQKDIETIRIYNKAGQIKFSNLAPEVDETTNIKAEACDICHRTDPPLTRLSLGKRTRIFSSANGYRRLGIISAIYNVPGCSASDCHFHPEEKQVLGALDVVVSLAETDQQIAAFERGVIGLAVFVFFATGAVIFLLMVRFLKQPISRLIAGTRQISKGDYAAHLDVEQNSEVGQLAMAIKQMGKEIGAKQAELNRQMTEYQNLFETVPCYITVQDRNYRLLQYNKKFADKFAPQPGDFCYRAYKGRSEKCVVCPVERTFEDGLAHQSEESGLNRHGELQHWVVQTSPIRNADGEIIAVMEMNLDITERTQLTLELEKSEKKYQEIFNNIPNPVFVLDADTLEILDCNDRIPTVYGFSCAQIKGQSFMETIPKRDRQRMQSELTSSAVINQVRQFTKEQKVIYVDVRISPSEYKGRKVLLVTTSDITKRLEAEQQLIQASKMATLGEMATGVAHELNQPLSVIKTASSFLMKKVRKKEPIPEDILFTMAEEVDSHVDRASKIINHMREFGRKSDLNLVKVQVNQVLERSFEIFSQQLKVRGIRVEWNLDSDLPEITADPDRLEQVFINLLINARDAIIDRLEAGGQDEVLTKIFLRTRGEADKVIVEVCDTGVGIPPAVKDKIFDPFFTTKEVGKGTGLGLSISYSIITEFGGSISAVGNEPQGSCFIITLPREDETAVE
ncbi:MAG: histidine kinase [Deltaproteobacteria bacterium SG8_13]|nr:MAG: histidine kinase [Deltaproteobacteria bacterium SG8_13]